MKQFIIIFISFFLFTGQSFGQLQELIKQKENAIFAIYTYDDFGVATGIGTGFFISSDGIGISNYHVLEDASRGVIKTIDGKTYEINEVLSLNEQADIIKFKVNIEGDQTNYLSTKTEEIERGERIFVIGNPHGFESTVSDGIISSIRQSDDYGHILQITAPISPGSSGSPVMTYDGKVVGIATFQFSEGQNLNFAVSTNSLNNLSPPTFNAISSSRPDILIINERSVDNSELILNSIEFKESETIINFSFTNVSMGFGPQMLIWTSFSDKDETFVIQDLNTLEKYYARRATIGTSRENGTVVSLGETKRFKVFFPPLPKTVTRVNIMEGISSSWKFLDLDLTNYLNLEQQDTENHSKNFALVKLESQEYEAAKSLLSESVEINKADHQAYNIMGIISYVIDNNYDALQYFSKAIEINPNNSIYYFNRYRVYFENRNDFENALKDINSAIRILPTQGDYYQYRAYVYMEMQEWEQAVMDWDMAINLMGKHWYLLKERGSSKTWINDHTGACRDWDEANRLLNYSDDQLKEWIRQVCR